LEKYYGTTRHHVRRGLHQTGAGNPPEEEDSENDDNDDYEGLGDRVAADQQHHIRHEPSDVPMTECPFNEEMETIFYAGLTEAEQIGLLPADYGVRQEEWEDGEYPTFEHIKTGQKRKEIRVNLPDIIWRKRAERWAQGLDCMLQLLYLADERSM
jgi:hypothetical protein